MECEVPEVVVFLKENGCQFFKDLCVDGEVPCHDKCYMENCELDHNNISNLLNYELARNSTDVSEEVLLYISTRAEESFSKHDCIHDDVKLCGAQNKLMGDKAVPSGTADISIDVCSSKKELSERLNFTTSEQITNLSLSQLFNFDDLRDQQQNHQEDPNTETTSANCWSGKEADCKNCNGVDPRSELDLGAERITNDSGSQRITDDNGKRPKSEAIEQTPETENMSEMADNMSKIPLLVSSSSLSHQTTVCHRQLGSSSFSAASTPSCRLTFSGSIPNSDSTSLRSNSTASTRSFAFPILSTEWNESPIRMAEVDSTRPKKCGCWRMCFTCSKF